MTIEAPLEGRIALVTGGGRGIGRAAMVTFLVSDRGAHLTDQRLTVDGGTF